MHSYHYYVNPLKAIFGYLHIALVFDTIFRTALLDF